MELARLRPLSLPGVRVPSEAAAELTPAASCRSLPVRKGEKVCRGDRAERPCARREGEAEAPLMFCGRVPDGEPDALSPPPLAPLRFGDRSMVYVPNGWSGGTPRVRLKWCLGFGAMTWTALSGTCGTEAGAGVAWTGYVSRMASRTVRDGGDCVHELMVGLEVVSYWQGVNGIKRERQCQHVT